ncbi:SRPBCC family protein [Fimbriiglobus ruber]|uniref:Putative glutathione S-transferase-related transmembrane protein n=1 Tax=Fimbriiglobus ruber TaxID=1908690 RepID=A0A225DWX6_9BACT|nr:SRPBCC domain-containing protein [Fimbriiglobus ruber]OWK41699.1 putative glutathione S-transferase-related transmembrane protein [Fimbriiglobus ruber]
MVVSKPSTAAASNRDVFITRVFDAPRDLVFRAWTTPEYLARWYAPKGCTTLYRSFDFHPGGTFHSCIRSPNGYECWCIGAYREIVVPERIAYTLVIANEKGSPVDPEAAGMDPNWPQETTVTVTFEGQNGKTKLTLRQTVSELIAKRTGAHPSWLEMLDRLAINLAQD